MAARQIGRAYDAALAPSGLNTNQYAILANIQRYQPVSQMELAQHLKLERTTLYRAVGLMERKGWVRAGNSGKGVEKVLAVTGRGAALLGEARRSWELVHSRFLEAYGARKWEEFLRTLEDVQSHFRGYNVRIAQGSLKD